MAHSPLRRCMRTAHLWSSSGLGGDILNPNDFNHSTENNHDCPDCNNANNNLPTDSIYASHDGSLTVWLFDVIVVYVISNLFFVVGILGNIVNIIIFFSHNIVTYSTNTLLLVLAILDLIIVLLNGVINVTFLLSFSDQAPALTVQGHTWIYVSIINRWVNMVKLDIVAVLSIQNATVVLFPFKVSAIFSQRNTNIVIAFLILFGLTGVIPTFASSTPQNKSFYAYFTTYNNIISNINNNDDNFTVYSGTSLTYDQITHFVTFYWILHNGLDLGVIIVCGTITVLRIKREANKRVLLTAIVIPSAHAMNPGIIISKREANIVKISLLIYFSVVLVQSFTICYNYLLFHIDIAESAHDPFHCMNEYLIRLLFVVIGSANFFIYMGLSSDFRTSFRNRMMSGLRRKQPPH